MKATGTLLVTLILSINATAFGAAQRVDVNQLRSRLAASARAYAGETEQRRPSILKKRRKARTTQSLSIISSQIESTSKELEPLRFGSLTITTEHQLGLLLRLAKVFIFGFTNRVCLNFSCAVDAETAKTFITHSIYPIIKNYYHKTASPKTHRVIINYCLENEIEKLATSLENLNLKPADFDNSDITPFFDTFGEL